MTKDQKKEVIEALKGKFSQYTNFYVADTESLTVAQVGKLRRACFNKQVEMKVAKNTLIKKALESLDNEKYSGVYDSLHKVTALMFSENPKDPALIITTFRKESNGEKPILKAAFINGDVYMGNDQLVALTKIKTKNELIGEVIGLLQSPAKRVIAALLNHADKKTAGETATVEKETKAVAVEEPKAVVTEEPKAVTAEQPKAVVAEQPKTVTEEKPSAEVEAKPSTEAATKPVDDTEVKPADDAATKPTEE
jgi:large subunit ribosomal protein L10